MVGFPSDRQAVAHAFSTYRQETLPAAAVFESSGEMSLLSEHAGCGLADTGPPQHADLLLNRGPVTDKMFTGPLLSKYVWFFLSEW